MKTQFHLDYPTIMANQARPVHFAIRFEAEGSSNPRPQAAAFCAVLDRSGSMAGSPLAHAKEAAKVAIRNLRQGDRFSLVVFDDGARTLIPLQPANQRQRFYDIIDQIKEGGSTNLTGGWMLGRDELRKAESGTTRRLLLLSDGLLNQGIVEPAEVRQIVSAGLENDAVRTSCLGFGNGYNEDLMAEMARVTNGQFYDADSPEKLPSIFSAELDGLQKVSVQNLRVRVQAMDFCDNYSLMGEYPSVPLPDGRTEFAIGDLVMEEERIVCFGVQALPLPLIDGKPAFDLEGEQLLNIEVLWDEISVQGVVSQTLTQQIKIQGTQDPANVVVNSVVVPWVSLQMAGKVVMDATKKLDSGLIQEAISSLDKAIHELTQYGDLGKEAIKVLQDMKGKIGSGEWTVRERKQSIYGSVHFRKMSSKSKWTLNSPAPSYSADSSDKNNGKPLP